MSEADEPRAAIELAMAHEELRQRQETFNQRKSQDRTWFRVRVAMSCVSIVAILLIGYICAYIVFHAANFPDGTVTLAAAGLVADILATMLAVWRLVLGKGPQELGPLDRPTASQGRDADASFRRQVN